VSLGGSLWGRVPWRENRRSGPEYRDSLAADGFLKMIAILAKFIFYCCVLIGDQAVA